MPTPLQTELANPAYSGLSDQQAAGAINAKAARALVALADWSNWPYEDSTYYQLTQAASAVLPAATNPSYAGALAVKSAATTVLGYITNPKIEHIDMDLPATTGAIAALVGAGVIAPDFVDRVDALANVPWWQSVGLARPVTAIDVRNARRQIENW
jgi:hypothetical protein